MVGEMTKIDRQPLVTVLLPAYNEEQSIGKTIALIKDRYPDFEVLVVDDG